LGEGRLGMIAGEFPHQVHVRRIGHLLIISADHESGQIIFQVFVVLKFLGSLAD
jgi:hypothetical protein